MRSCVPVVRPSALLAVLATMGCATHPASAGTSNDTAVDAATEAPLDSNADGDAAAVDSRPPLPTLPTVPYGHGPILANPKVVTVTFGADGDPSADPERAFIENFDDTILATPWWDAVTAGYCDDATPKHCIGHGTNGGHVHVTEAPAASYTDGPDGHGSLRDLMQGWLTNGVLPLPDADTVYAIWFPAPTKITSGALESCGAFYAYHASFLATLPSGSTVDVPYIVMPRCTGNERDLAVSASHELIETATDPVSRTNDPLQAGTAFAVSDEVWPAIAGGHEVADLCELTQITRNWKYDEGPFVVAKSWSNIAAAAGHDPCVPAPDPKASPYVITTAAKDLVEVEAGTPTTIELYGYSDAPVSDWEVFVRDISGGALTFGLDDTHANNGKVLHLIVTMRAGTPSGKVRFLQIMSGNTSVWPLGIKVK